MKTDGKRNESEGATRLARLRVLHNDEQVTRNGNSTIIIDLTLRSLVIVRAMHRAEPTLS